MRQTKNHMFERALHFGLINNQNTYTHITKSPHFILFLCISSLLFLSRRRPFVSFYLCYWCVVSDDVASAECVIIFDAGSYATRAIGKRMACWEGGGSSSRRTDLGSLKLISFSRERERKERDFCFVLFFVYFYEGNIKMCVTCRSLRLNATRIY